MKKKGLWRVFSNLILILCAIIMINLLMGFGDSKSILKSYDNIKPDSSSGLQKNLQFIEGYTRLTGDVSLALNMGYDSSVINSWNNSANGEPGGTGDTGVTGTITSSDITAIVKSICTSYTSGFTPNAKCYVAGPVSYARTPYGTVTFDNKALAPYNTNGVYNRCCNGLASGILFLCGVETYKNGSEINKRWPYISCDDIWDKIGTQMQPTKFGDLQVGDILCVYKKGNPNDVCHVETVVKIAGDDVYIASAGSSKGIWSCASEGYSRKKSASSALSDFYNSRTSSGWGGLKGVIRP